MAELAITQPTSAAASHMELNPPGLKPDECAIRPVL
jgi:hypothetical protein